MCTHILSLIKYKTIIYFYFRGKIEFTGRNEKVKRVSLPVPLHGNGKLYGIAAVTGKCP